MASSAGADLAGQAVEIGGVKVLAAELPGADPKTLRNTVDQLKDKLGQAVVVLATVNGEKVALAGGVTKAETDKLHAGKIVGAVAQQVGGKGGGRPDMAQAGGSDAAALPAALDSVKALVEEALK